MKPFKFTLLISLLLVSTQTLAQTFWKCESDQRATGGTYQSVTLEKSGNYILKLWYTFIDVGNNSVINHQELISDLRCRFHGKPAELVQCVSTNFTNSLETIADENLNSQWLIKIKSHRLVWPESYRGQKIYGHQEFLVDTKAPNSFCGFVESSENIYE